MDESPQDRPGSLPIAIKSDQDLVREHQRKVDASVEELNRSLADVEQKLACSRHEFNATSQRVALTEEQRAAWHRAKDRYGDNRFPGAGHGLFGREPDFWEDNVTAGGVASTEFEHLLREKSRLRAVCEELNAKRVLLLRQKTATINPVTLQAFSLSLVRRIPTDILLNIFDALNSLPHKIPPRQGEFDKMPGRDLTGVGDGAGPLLARVCSQWRAIACDYPLLWSSFSFPIFSQGSAKLVDLYLQRSKSAPLTVEIDARPQVAASSTGELAIALLAARSHHLFELRILALARDVSISIPSLQALRDNLPCLEILQLPVWPALSTEFASVPHLHTLRLCSGTELAPATHHFDRSRIRCLTLADASGHQLAPYTNVTEFTSLEIVKYPRHAISTRLPDPPMSPGVGAWTVRFDKRNNTTSSWGISNIFRRFTFPALHSLDVEFRADPSELTGFLHRSQCNLTKLVMRDCNVRISALLQILELTPNLETFAVVGGHATMITDRLFAFLAAHVDMVKNLAKLSSLTLTGSFAFATAALVGMLEVRTAHDLVQHRDVCLNDVYLSLPDRAVPVQVVERLRALRGVMVSLECIDNHKAMHRPL
ncbi:hypothetical protein DFH06DRAFT_475005 [Mycena polygramma]|nr:hypothetical protein DFH06DRAFT_475005 [Mycena polygramma]